MRLTASGNPVVTPEQVEEMRTLLLGMTDEEWALFAGALGTMISAPNLQIDESRPAGQRLVIAGPGVGPAVFHLLTVVSGEPPEDPRARTKSASQRRRQDRERREADAKAMRAAGMTAREIAEAMGVSTRTVTRYLRVEGANDGGGASDAGAAKGIVGEPADGRLESDRDGAGGGQGRRQLGGLPDFPAA